MLLRVLAGGASDPFIDVRYVILPLKPIRSRLGKFKIRYPKV